MRIDRLARSTFDLFGIVKRIADAKAQFRSLAEPWADTGTSRHAEGATLAELINDTVKSHYFKVTSIPNERLEEIDELPQNPPSLRIAYRQAIRATDANARLARLLQCLVVPFRSLPEICLERNPATLQTN
jgi:hypothetical protein